MADQETSDLDAVAEGPEPSDGEGEAGARAPDAPLPPHPSVEALRAKFGDAILQHEISAGDQHVVHVDPDRNVEILGWLKADPDQTYDLLRDVTAVDYGGDRPLQVVYQLWSMEQKRTLRLKCTLPLSKLEIGSACGLWKAANWLEREVYDMFGIEFLNHPDLRRILMPENYAEGHPLRKDFPLRGRFSRAEQTRRALSQDPRDHYVPAELEVGDKRAQLLEGMTKDRPELPDETRDAPDLSEEDE